MREKGAENKNDRHIACSGLDRNYFVDLRGSADPVRSGRNCGAGFAGDPHDFLGALLAAWIGDFQHITWVPLVVLGVLTVIGLAVDWVAQTMGAQRAGASKWGILGSLIGTIAGLFMGIVGILFMPLVGAFIGEYIAQRDLRVAGNVGWATWVGMMVGTVVKLGLSFVMIGIMCFALWF